MADELPEGVEIADVNPKDQGQEAREPQEPQQEPQDDTNIELERLRKENERLRKENGARRIATKGGAADELIKANEERDSLLERMAATESMLEQIQAEKAEAVARVRKNELLDESGIPSKFAHLVAGNTEDEWAESIKSLADLMGQKAVKPDPVQVAAANPTNKKTTREQLAEGFFAGLG